MNYFVTVLFYTKEQYFWAIQKSSILMSSLAMQICSTLVLSVTSINIFDTIMSDISWATTHNRPCYVLTSMICTGRWGQNRLGWGSTPWVEMAWHGTIWVLLHIKGPSIGPGIGPGIIGPIIHKGFNIREFRVTRTTWRSNTVLIFWGILSG